LFLIQWKKWLREARARRTPSSSKKQCTPLVQRKEGIERASSVEADMMSAADREPVASLQTSEQQQFNVAAWG